MFSVLSRLRSARLYASNLRRGLIVPVLAAIVVVVVIVVCLLVHSRADERRDIEEAGRINKLLYHDLAYALGRMDRLKDFPLVKEAVLNSYGTLSIDDKVSVVSVFAEAGSGGMTTEQIVKGLDQCQKAAVILGPSREFASALSLTLFAGVNQRRAGDIALAVAQSGKHALPAYETAVARYCEMHPERRDPSGDVFIDYLRHDPGAFRVSP